GRSAAQGAPPPTPDPVGVADAYLAAWNARDLPAVLARFAPDALVRERRGDVPAAVWDARDPAVVRAYLDRAPDGQTPDPSGLVWAAGHPAIAAWATARFGFNHRYAAGPRRAAGDTAGWAYREFADPYQLLPGVEPVEGDAEAVVRDGRITRLTLVLSPPSVARQRAEVEAVTARARPPAARTAPGGGGAPPPAPRPGRGPPPAPGPA